MADPISMTTTCQKIATTLRTITQFADVYGPDTTDGTGIPATIQNLPCAIVHPGADIDYKISNGIHEHTYEVMVQCFESGVDASERAKSMLPFIDRIITAFAGQVKLAGNVVYCLYRRQSGFVTLQYGDAEFLGYEVVLEVKETAQITPAVGT